MWTYANDCKCVNMQTCIYIYQTYVWLYMHYIYMFCLQLLVRRCIVFKWHLHILCHYLHVHIIFIYIYSHMSQHKSYPTHAPRRWPVESFGKTGQYVSLIFVVGWAGLSGCQRSCSHAHYLDATLTRPSLALVSYLDAASTRSFLALATRPKASPVGAQVESIAQIADGRKSKIRFHCGI